MSGRRLREEVWRRITTDLPVGTLDAMSAKAHLDDIPELGKTILKGQVRGRTVIEIG